MLTFLKLFLWETIFNTYKCFFIRSVFLDIHGLRLQHSIFFSRIITPLVICRTYSGSSYSFCSYRTIADKNCIIWTRHFEQFDLNSLALRNLNILPLILFTFAPCWVDWTLVKVRTWLPASLFVQPWSNYIWSLLWRYLKDSMFRSLNIKKKETKQKNDFELLIKIRMNGFIITDCLM